tara:strand:+ start:12611 stop:13762 length:1152 start_codon:yes stop_codon:yes gene_type:complete
MTLDDLKSKAHRKLNEALRALILGEDSFPLPIPIAKPKTTADLSELRSTISLIRSQSREELGYGYSVEWQTVKSRRYGESQFPGKLSFSTVEDYLRYVGAVKESEQILSNVDTICDRYPSARAWCASNLNFMRKEQKALQHLLLVVNYLKVHPAPGVYARQLPVPVPTKFIEQERGMLDSFVQNQLPYLYIQADGTFEERVGILTKESLIEFRSLDPNVSSLPFRHAMATAREMAGQADLFDEYDTVLVVENHVSFLTVPDLPRTLAIMGNGFAVRRLSRIQWLSGKRLLYWGDIDLSGFSILATFRESYPDVRSIMMDHATFDHFTEYQQSHKAEQAISATQLALLGKDERTLVERLQANSKIRLEQEHISFSYAKETIIIE